MCCPACRRRVTSEKSCPRCGLDLTLLFDLQKKYDEYLNLAQIKLKQQNFQEAHNLFLNAFRINNTDKTKKGMFVCLAAIGKYKEAMQFYFSIFK